MFWITLWLAMSPVDQAREATRDLLSTLQQVLRAQLQEQGPVGAIAVCRDTAQALLRRVSQRYGSLYIRRVSTRWRNPADIPTPDEAALLDTLASRAQKGQPLPEEWVDTLLIRGRPYLRYARILRIQGVCLTCHGASLPPDVEAILDRLYPHDQARGYREGDLRGMVVVKIPLNGGKGDNPLPPQSAGP